MFRRAALHLAGHAPEPHHEELPQVPPRAIGAQPAQVVDVRIPVLVDFPHLGRVDLVQPVVLREKLANVVIEAVDALLHIGVFFDAPIAVAQIIREHLDGRADERIQIARPGPLFAVQNVRLGRTGMAVFNEHLLDKVLNALDVRHIPVEPRLRQFQDFRRQRLGAAKVVAAARRCRLENGPGDFLRMKLLNPAVAFADPVKHARFPFPDMRYDCPWRTPG